MFKLLEKLLSRYVVVAIGDHGTKYHYATDFADAIAWAKCYGECDHIEIYEQFLGFMANDPVASRTSSGGWFKVR